MPTDCARAFASSATVSSSTFAVDDATNGRVPEPAGNNPRCRSSSSSPAGTWAELVEPVRHRHTPTAPGQFPDAMLEVVEGSITPTQLRSSKGETEKRHLVGATDPALVLVDRELQLPVQVPCDA